MFLLAKNKKDLRVGQTKQERNMLRNKWEFEYTAINLATAAEAQRDFRLERVKWWEAKKAECFEKIKESGIEIHEGVAAEYNKLGNSTFQITPQVSVNSALERDLTECAQKIRAHKDAAQGYDGWVQVLKGNPEARLKLNHEDWLYFFSK